MPEAPEKEQEHTEVNDTATDTETSQSPEEQSAGSQTHVRPIKRGPWKTFYVRTLLFFLPLAIKIFTFFSKKARAEHDYLPAGFVFALDIRGWGRGVVLQTTKKNWKKLKRGTPASHVDYVIEFRDPDYAFEVFAANITLKQALAGRLFATYGPNDKGVAITYLFTIILKALFGWRRTYRNA